MFKRFKKDPSQSQIRDQIKYIAGYYCRFQLFLEGRFDYNHTFCFIYPKQKKENQHNAKDFEAKMLIKIYNKEKNVCLYIRKEDVFDDLKYIRKRIENTSVEDEYDEMIKMDLYHKEKSFIENLYEFIDLSEEEQKLLYKTFKPKILEFEEKCKQERIEENRRYEEEQKIEKLKQKELENNLLNSIKFKGKKC